MAADTEETTNSTPKKRAPRKAASKTAAKKPATKKSAPKKTAASKSPAKKPAPVPDAETEQPQPEPQTSASATASTADRNTEDAPKIDPDLLDKLWRILGMVTFGIVGFILFHFFAAMAVLQFLVVFVQSEPNKSIGNAMDWARAWFFQIFDFLAFTRDDYPFPLGEDPLDD